MKKVGTVSVKTVFGHLYFLPLIPMGSYYVDKKNDAAFELNSLNLRSITCGYLRVWGPAVAMLSLLLLQAPDGSGVQPLAAVGLLLGVAGLLASYIFDKKVTIARISSCAT